MSGDGPGAMWSLGDYDRIARDTLTPLADELVRATAISPGVRVLDLATGTGNVALAAAARGGDVVGCDLAPALLEVGRREAVRRGLDVEWVEADVQALPFGDAAFDVVTSAVGVMFASDHRATAAELLRVCRPGGTIALVSWTPESWATRFFVVLSRYAARDPRAPAPSLWGTEAYLRDLLGAGIDRLETDRRNLVVDAFGSPQELCRYYRRHFAPVIATYAALADDPDAASALDDDLLDLATSTNLRRGAGPALYEYEYLLAVASRAGA